MSEVNISKIQLGLLWHTLGLRPECRDSRHAYRNRFIAGSGHSDVTELEALVILGLMGRRKPPAFCDQSEFLYYATESGEKLAIEKMPPAPPLPKRTNFDAYLDESECYDSFSHFLGINRPMFQQRGHWGEREFRMVRYPRGSVHYVTWRHYSLTNWSPYATLEVAGDWAPTQKEAKASYKESLKKYQIEERSKRRISQSSAA